MRVQNDSYEVLKSSLLIQYVKDKDLLRELTKTYNNIHSTNIQLERYSAMK